MTTDNAHEQMCVLTANGLQQYTRKNVLLLAFQTALATQRNGALSVLR
jgi:hypothetical protein